MRGLAESEAFREVRDVSCARIPTGDCILASCHHGWRSPFVSSSCGASCGCSSNAELNHASVSGVFDQTSRGGPAAM